MSLTNQNDDDLELQIDQLLSAVSCIDDERENPDLSIGLNQWPWTSDEDNPSYPNNINDMITDESNIIVRYDKAINQNKDSAVSGSNVSFIDGISIDPDVLRSLQAVLNQSTLDIQSSHPSVSTSISNNAASSIQQVSSADAFQQAILESGIGEGHHSDIDYNNLLESLDVPRNAEMQQNPNLLSMHLSEDLKDKWIDNNQLLPSANITDSSLFNSDQESVQLSIPSSDASILKHVVQLLTDCRASSPGNQLSVRDALHESNNSCDLKRENDSINNPEINNNVLSSYQQLISLAQLNNILSIPIQIVNDTLVIPTNALLPANDNAASMNTVTEKKLPGRKKSTVKEPKKRSTKTSKQCADVGGDEYIHQLSSNILDKLNNYHTPVSCEGLVNGNTHQLTRGKNAYQQHPQSIIDVNNLLSELNRSSITLHTKDGNSKKQHITSLQQNAQQFTDSALQENPRQQERSNPKLCRNKLVSTQPLVISRSTMCKPVSFHRGTQTSLNTVSGKDVPPAGLIPIPITIAVPVPMIVQDSVVPCCIPIPIPLPIILPIPVSSSCFDKLSEQLKPYSVLPSNYAEAEIIAEGARLKDLTETRTENNHMISKQKINNELEEAEDALDATIFAMEDQRAESINNQVDSSQLKWLVGVRCFCMWISSSQNKSTDSFLEMSCYELASTLTEFIEHIRRPDGSCYSAECIMYTCVCLHYFLKLRNRPENIFFDDEFTIFTDTLHDILKHHQIVITNDGQILSRIDEHLMWESKLLGCHSPFILLNTLFYFNTRFFLLKTVDDHMNISFSDIRQHTKKLIRKHDDRTIVGESKYLRYYPVQDQQVIYEQSENLDDPTRCAVRFYEFYRSKCPPQCFTGKPDCSDECGINALFYLEPERTATPESPIWFRSQGLSPVYIEKMLMRIKLLKEINEAHLTLDAMF